MPSFSAILPPAPPPQRGIFQIAFAIGTGISLPSKINIIRHCVSQTGGSLPKKAPHKRGWIMRVDILNRGWRKFEYSAG